MFDKWIGVFAKCCAIQIKEPNADEGGPAIDARSILQDSPKESKSIK